jgi:hypothetical protein
MMLLLLLLLVMNIRVQLTSPESKYNSFYVR